MTYGYFGTMRTKPGHRDEVIEILLRSSESLADVGCYSYVVGTSDTDADLICVSELWGSKEAHDASLQRPETRDAIAREMPMLTGLGVPSEDSR
ncbi:MAG: antibiotic biosynthesis monooxygenase [Dehalococcoidia bacterium]|nr:antibiotic biosynthesis monooxygenase [Dehalococcoidia bacterium]